MVNDGYLVTSKLYEKRILNGKDIVVVFKPETKGKNQWQETESSMMH